MDQKLKEIVVGGGIVVVSVVIGLFIYSLIVGALHKASPDSFMSGAAGNLLIEQYDPYVQQNGGINTALPITSSGGQTFSGNLANTGTLTQGSSGTATAQDIWKTGILIMPNYTSLPASTTLLADIAVTGATASDFVIGQFASSTNQLGAGWEITGASASSTPGFDTITFVNNTGTARTMPASIASTTKVLNRR